MNKDSIYRIIGYNGEYTASVKRAIRKLLKENHPDNKGDRKTFELINEVKKELEENRVSYNSKSTKDNIKINDELNKASEDKSLIENLDNDVINKNEIKENNMKIYFDDIEIPVTWENNETVLELQTEAERGGK